MKSNSLLALLVGALCVCGLMTLWISVRYYFSVKELQELQGHIVTMNRTRKAAQALAYEAVAYSKSNPAIIPLLQRYQVARPRSSTNAPSSTTNAPAQP